jgi:hypothetical protein
MSGARAPRPVCDADRAYRDLLGHPRTEIAGSISVCSPEIPEVRDYPAPVRGGARFVLCNGHLRDLFDELARSRGPVVRPTPA